MSDVDVIRELYDRMAAGDLAGLFELVDPSVVVTQDEALPWGGRFEGHDGLATFAIGLRTHIDSVVQHDAVFEADGEVVQVGRTRGVVIANGAPFDIPEVHRWRLAGGRAVQAHFAIDVPAMAAALSAPPDACPGCGREWSSIAAADVPRRLEAGAGAIAERLRSTPDEVLRRRPSPDVWSVLEYAGHVRDVLFHLRDRVAITLAESPATFKQMYRDVRVDAGMYRNDRPDVVAGELEVAAALFGRTFAAMDAGQLGRLCVYGYPSESMRTLRWLGQQAVHEIEHHGADIDALLAGG